MEDTGQRKEFLGGLADGNRYEMQSGGREECYSVGRGRRVLNILHAKYKT